MIKKIKSYLLEDSLQSKITKGILWSFLGTFISKGLMLLSFILVARFLSVEEYGQIGVLRNTITTFAAFSVMSFGVTATKYLAIYKDTSPIRAERILTFTRMFVFISSLLISILVFAFSDYITSTMLDKEALSFDVKITAFAIFFTALNGYQNGLLSGLEKFKELSYINIFNGLLSFPILISFTYFWKVNGVIIGITIISFLTWVMSAYYVNYSMKKHKLKYRFNDMWKEIEVVKDFSLPSFLSGLSIAPAILTTNLILAHQENGYYQLGIFNATYFFSIISKTLNGIVGQVIYPYSMQQFDKNNKKFEYFNIISPWVIGILLNLPLIVFPEILVMFFGSKYDTEDFKISVILVALFSIIIAHRQGISRNFAAANLMWWSVIGNLFWGLTLVIFTLYLSKYGSIGLAISFFIAYALNTLVFLPLYINKNLVDKKLLISIYSLLIWMLLFISSSLYFLVNNLIVKLCIFICIIFVCYYLFIMLWRKYND